MGDLLRKNSEAVRKRIENHAFSDEAGEEYEGSEFGGFGDYFRRKKIKLQNLDVELRASAEAAAKPQIFKGVVAHVTGYTQPPLHVLHKELVQHGAGFLQYLDSKTMATHIIASSMPPRKVIDFTKYRIVKPAWVTDSIAAGRLLPWSDYRVIDDGPRQKTIQFDGARMFSQSAQRSPRGYREQTENSFYTSQFKQKPTGSSSPAMPSSASKSSPFARAPVEGIQDEGELDMDDNNDEDDSFDDDDMATPSHATVQKPNHHDPKESEHPPDKSPKPPPPRQPPETPSEMPPPKPQQQQRQQKAPLTSEEHNALLLTDPHIRKSSTANPDFLKQYYSESRLHHLSNWKAQLKSRMQALAAQRSSSQKPSITTTKRPKPNSRRYILHVDFDSFFCAVSLKTSPEYIDKPAVVAHGSGSGSEIASCNYPARKFGVKNGMWMKRALELCPELKVLPYDFPGYEEASRQFYDAILDVGGVVQSVSIDEALVDVTGIVLTQTGSDGTGISEGSLWREQEVVDGIARNLKENIKEKTGCNVSVGIGGNVLLAKVALRKAKPAGQYQIRPEEVLGILGDLKVDELPGVAYSISSRLEEIGIKFVKDIRETSREKLVSTLGPKTGEKLWDYARGIDRAEVGEQPIRKSVSADVNWGIRFISQEEAEEFVRNLSKELERRLLNEGVKGKHLSMKIMRRAIDAPLDPPKHLGHGKCDTFNKSVAFGVATNSWEMIGKEAVAILRSYRFSPGDLRGLGLQMTKLEPLKPSTSNVGTDGSSQMKLNFGNAAVKRPPPQPIDEESGSKRFKSAPASSENESDPITEDPLTPRKPKVHPAIALSRAREADEKARTPLNISGTQFIIPTSPDPEVLAELPNDIRTKLLNQAKAKNSREASPAINSNNTSRSHSPAVGASDIDAIPADIDPEVFNALPDDVKAEVLAQYKHQPPQPQQDTAIRPGRQSILPQSPRRGRLPGPGRPPKDKPSPITRGGGSGSVKSLFARAGAQQQQQQQQQQPQQPTSVTSRNDPAFELPEGIDPDFLSELPADVRQEILSEHFRAEKSKSLLKVKAQDSTTASSSAAGRAQLPKITFPPPPPKITFSRKGVYSTPQVREMISAWHAETQQKGPHMGDVDMLERYLRSVVLEERDLEKVQVLVKYLAWIVEEGTEEGGGEGKRLWVEALGRIRRGVDKALGERGMGPMFGTGTPAAAASGSGSGGGKKT